MAIYFVFFCQFSSWGWQMCWHHKPLSYWCTLLTIKLYLQLLVSFLSLLKKWLRTLLIMMKSQTINQYCNNKKRKSIRVGSKSSLFSLSIITKENEKKEVLAFHLEFGEKWYVYFTVYKRNIWTSIKKNSFFQTFF